MTKIHLFILSTLFIFPSFGQTKKSELSKQIVSTRTTKHKLVPGTNVFIIPPPGFSLGSKESALRFQDSIFISVETMIGFSYAENSKSFTRESFAKNKMTVIEFSEIQINDLPAKIALFKIGTDNVYQVITGTSNFTNIVMASYPSTNESLGKAIKKSLETIYCDETLKTDPFYSSAFRLDDTRSNFKLARSNNSYFLFAKGGIVKPDYDSEPYVILRQLSFYPGIDLKKIADKELGVRGIKIDKTDNESKGNINSNETYERTVFGKHDGKEICAFQKLVAIGRFILVFQGFSQSDFEKNLVEFKKLGQSIRQQ